MKLLEIDIRGFGKMVDRQIKLGSHANVIYGHNEAGKSTIHAFLRAMFYGFERGKGRAAENDTFSKYDPWDSSSYGGSLLVSYEDHNYRITRDFHKSSQDLTIIDADTQESVADAVALLDNMRAHLSETAYMNTVSIGQLKSATDDNMVAELKSYITNMNTTGNMSLDTTKATAYLQDHRAEYVSHIVPEAAKSYTADLSEIKSIETELSSPIYISKIRSLQEGRQTVLDKQSSLASTKVELASKQASDKQLLESNHFSSESDIEDLRKKTHDSYDIYKTTDRKAHSKVFKAVSIILMILALLSLALTVFVYLTMGHISIGYLLQLDYISSFYVCWIVSVIFFVIDIVLISVNNHYVRRYKKAAKAITAVLSDQLGDAQISDDAIAALDARLDGFRDTYQACADRESHISDISAQLSELKEEQIKYDSDLESQHRSQYELEKKLEHLANLKEEADALKKAMAENERLQFEIDAIDLAQDTMNELSATIKDSFGLYLNKEASDLVAAVTGGIYSSMSIDEDLSVYMNTETKMVPIEQVSSGTMDQIYLALRLASAKLMQGDSEKLPLIFDDSFVNYDENRLATALKWLVSSYESQIIIFTCHKREAQLLSSALIDYTLIEL